MAFQKMKWIDVPDPNNMPTLDDIVDRPEYQNTIPAFDAENMNRIEEGIDAAHKNKLDKLTYEENRNNDLKRTNNLESYVHSGDLGFFKELIGRVSGFRWFVGAINNKLYYYYNSDETYYINTIDVNTGNIEPFAEIPLSYGDIYGSLSSYSDNLFLSNENTIYIATTEKVSNGNNYDIYLSFWIITKDNIPIKIGTSQIATGVSYDTYMKVYGCVVSDEYIYMRVVDEHNRTKWIYKSPIKTNTNTSTRVFAKAYGNATGSAAKGRFILAGKDIYDDNTLYRNCDFSNGIEIYDLSNRTIYPTNYDVESDVLACTGDIRYPLWKKENHMPLLLNLSVSYFGYTFVYGGYMYVYGDGGFIFRTKVLNTI